VLSAAADRGSSGGGSVGVATVSGLCKHPHHRDGPGAHAHPRALGRPARAAARLLAAARPWSRAGVLQQKALIVKMVRTGVSPPPMTLAIGMARRRRHDSASGGRRGHQRQGGSQAANAADFSIAQFRFLRRLMLVDGAGDDRRMTKWVGATWAVKKSRSTPSVVLQVVLEQL